jgi:RNA polymerase sigma-70 factor (ECF subfamily)
MMLLADSNTTGEERDAILWREMKEGNEFAFREIFELFSNPLFKYGWTIVKDRELVKDCVQELFISLWTSRQSIGTARSVKYYLFYSLRRLILKKANRSRRFLSLASFKQEKYIIEGQEQAIMLWERKNKQQWILSKEIEKLPPRQKEVICLKFYQQLKNEEIEAIMNLNNQVVRNTLYKALKGLRQQMGKWQSIINALSFLVFHIYLFVTIS